MHYCNSCKINFSFRNKNNISHSICEFCGGPLIKKDYIDFKSIAALIAIFSFILPIFLLAFSVIIDTIPDKDINKQNPNIIKI